jgi:endonuclease YncB( thermonuclease family)
MPATKKAPVIRKTRIRVATGPVLRVYDGDTFILEFIDMGWGSRIYPIDEGEPGYCSIRVTLPGCVWYDAPEKSDKARDKLATEYAKTLLPVGTWVEIKSYGFSAGRTLASVTLPDGQDLATLMVAAGHTK